MPVWKLLRAAGMQTKVARQMKFGSQGKAMANGVCGMLWAHAAVDDNGRVVCLSEACEMSDADTRGSEVAYPNLLPSRNKASRKTIHSIHIQVLVESR